MFHCAQAPDTALSSGKGRNEFKARLFQVGNTSYEALSMQFFFIFELLSFT
jgi:hypothetical protein